MKWLVWCDHGGEGGALRLCLAPHMQLPSAALGADGGPSHTSSAPSGHMETSVRPGLGETFIPQSAQREVCTWPPLMVVRTREGEISGDRQVAPYTFSH